MADIHLSGAHNQDQQVGHGGEGAIFNNIVNNYPAGQSCLKAIFKTRAESLQNRALDMPLSLP